MAVKKPTTECVPITIERMQSDDVEKVAELDRECFPTPWSASAYATEVRNPSAYYVVARADGEIIGYAGMWLIMDEAHITTLGVDPDYRGKKVGERILVHLLDEAIQRGAQRATLEVREHNTAAQRLYDKYAFHTVAVRKAYYTDNREDALVMWIDDMRSPDFLRDFRMRKQQLAQEA